MKTMLWKELRENFKWAVLAFLGLLLAEIYTLSSQRQGHSGDYQDLTLCSSAFLLASAFGCAAIGAALAVLQILPELRRDQWASLLHRPVSRHVIFFGKVLGGLLLYLGATTLPFLASVAYVATPGQFAAPLVPGMLLPGISDIGFGAVCYFAALLLCLHRGRWFGSRGAAGLAIAAVFVWHLGATWPELLSLVFGLIFLGAAWGAMLGNGPLPTRPRAGRIAFALVVLTGSQAAFLLLLLGLRSLSPVDSFAWFVYHQFAITRDGKVFVQSQHGNDQTQVLTDLDGKVVTDERYVGNSGRETFCEMLPVSFDLRRGFSGSSIDWRLPRQTWSYVDVINDNQSKEVWYLLLRQNYFIGYDKLSRRAVGIYDADGFKAAGAMPRPFPAPMEAAEVSFRTPHLYRSGAQVHAIQFSERSSVVITLPDDAIYGAVNLSGSYFTNGPSRIAVALAHEVRLFDPQGMFRFRVPYAHDSATWPCLSMATNAAADRFYLQFAPESPFWGEPVKRDAPPEPMILDEIGPTGKLLQSYRFPNAGFTASPMDWVDCIYLFVSPFLPTVTRTVALHDFSPSTFPPTETYGPASSFPPVAPHAPVTGLAMLLAIAVVLGGLTWFQARRIGFSARRAWAWAALVFCFGLPGLLTFRLASAWPTRVRCLRCGGQRPVGTEECPRCHQAWLPPEPTGAEIFSRGEIVRVSL